MLFSSEHQPTSRDGYGAKYRATFVAKMDAEYKGKVFDIVEEIHLPKGKVFKTKFGRRGRHGWIIQDRHTGDRQVVGWPTMKMIHEWYQGVTLPNRTRIRLRRECNGDQ